MINLLQGVRNHGAWTAVLAAVILGLARPAACDFVPPSDQSAGFYNVVLGALAFDGRDTKSFDNVNYEFSGFHPAIAVADAAAAGDGTVSASVSGTQVSRVSPSLITFTGQVNGEFSADFRFGDHTAMNGDSGTLTFFDVEPPGLNVTASAGILLNTSNLQQHRAEIRLQRVLGLTFVVETIFNMELSAPGSDSHAEVFNGFLAPGSYRIITAAQVAKDQFFGDDLPGFGLARYELIIVGNACGNTQIQTFNLPPEGVPFDITVQVGKTDITVPVNLVGSVTAELLLDCQNQITAVTILSIDIDALEQSILFDLGGGSSGTVSNVHFGADSLVGMLGPPAAVLGGCCGTIAGVMPHLTGDAVITTPDMTIPLTMDVPLGELYSGIDFDLSTLAVAGSPDYQLTLHLDHVLPSDIGLGDLNPTLILLGDIYGSTAPQCAAADLDCNGVINGIDLGILLSQWFNPGSADLDGDRDVDGIDLGILLNNWTL